MSSGIKSQNNSGGGRGGHGRGHGIVISKSQKIVFVGLI